MSNNLYKDIWNKKIYKSPFNFFSNDNLSNYYKIKYFFSNEKKNDS